MVSFWLHSFILGNRREKSTGPKKSLIVYQEMNFLDQCNAFVKCRVNLVLVTISLKIPFVEYHIGGFFH